MPLKLLGTKLYAHCIKKKDILWLSALAVHTVPSTLASPLNITLFPKIKNTERLKKCYFLSETDLELSDYWPQ